MATTVKEIMSDHVRAATPNDSLAHARNVMDTLHIHAIPVVNSDGEPVGIVTSRHVRDTTVNEATPLESVIDYEVETIARDATVSEAIDRLLEHHIHHLVVVHDLRVVGIISSFDVLRTFRDHLGDA